MGGSIISVSIEETNIIRKYFGLNLIPVPAKATHKSTRQTDFSNTVGPDNDSYDRSEFIDANLLKKSQRNKKLSLSMNSLIESDDESKDDSDWLSKLEKHPATDAVTNTIVSKKSRIDTKEKLAKSIIMTLKEQDMLNDDLTQEVKDVLTREKEYDQKDLSSVEKSFKHKREDALAEQETRELQAIKKSKRVEIKGKIRVSFNDHNDAEEGLNDDYAPIKIKKRKKKSGSKISSFSNEKFEIKKVELTNEDYMDDEVEEMDQVLFASRKKSLASKKMNRAVTKMPTRDEEPSTLLKQPVTTSFYENEAFLESLKRPILVTSANSPETQSTDPLPEEVTVEKDNFYDGLASTLNFVKNNLHGLPKSVKFSKSDDLPSLTKAEVSPKVQEGTDVNTEISNPEITLKYTDEKTGEELSAKKAFQQFNKNFYNKKKRNFQMKP